MGIKKWENSLPPYLLSAVVPVTQMQGQLDLLESWMQVAIKENIQVILVHDWRDEETEKELKDILKKLGLGESELISGEFGSPGNARNEGLKKVKARWVTFWDSDDLPNVENFVQMVDTAEKLNCNVAIGGFSYVNSREEQKDKGSGIPRMDELDNLVSILKNPGLWRWAFKYEILEGVTFSSNRMGEDQHFLIALNAFRREKYIHNEIVYNYRINQKSQLTNNPYAILELKKTIREVVQLIDKNFDFVNTFLMVRMLMTSIKKGSFLMKIQALPDFFYVLQMSGLAISAKDLAQIYGSRKR